MAFFVSWAELSQLGGQQQPWGWGGSGSAWAGGMSRARGSGVVNCTQTRPLAAAADLSCCICFPSVLNTSTSQWEKGFFWVFCRNFQCLSVPLENCAGSVVPVLQPGRAGPARSPPGLCLGGGSFALGLAWKGGRLPPQPALLLHWLKPWETGKWGFGAAGLLWGWMGLVRGAQLLPSISLLPVGMTDLASGLASGLAHLQQTPELP